MELSGRDIAAALSAVTIWGLNFVAMKYGLRDFTPFQLGFFRYVFAVIPLIFFIPKPNLGWAWLLPAGLTQLAQFALLFLALQFDMTAALASVLMQTQILFTAILGAVLLGERISPPMRIGFALAAVGLTCFVLNFVTGADAAGVTVLGLILNLGSAFAMASSNVLARKAQSIDADYDPLQFVVWMSLVPIIPFGLLAWFCEPADTHWQWINASPLGWCSAAFLGWLATIAAYGFWTDLLKRHPANRVSPFGLGVPVVGLAAGTLALGEQVSAWQWAGSAFVIAALVAVIRTPRVAASMAANEAAD